MPNTVAKFGDQVINKGVRRVAPDGKTMGVDVVSIDRDGKETSFRRAARSMNARNFADRSRDLG